MFISASTLADNIKSIPNKFTGLWADSVKTCRTQAPSGDYMLLVNVSAKQISGNYTESSFTYNPISMEDDWIHNNVINTAGWYAPYYDENGEDQEKPKVINIMLFMKDSGLFILPLSSKKLVKCL